MFTIRTKFKPGQEVFLLDEGKTVTDKVKTVKTESDEKETGVIYELEQSGAVAEDSIFETKREIAEFLGLVPKITRKPKTVAPNEG